MDTELQVLSKRLVKLGKVVLVLRNLRQQVHALFNDVLANHLENLVLLQRLSRNVQRQILRVHDTLHKVQVLGDQVLAVVHDKHPAHVKLDVVALLLRLEQVKGCTAIPSVVDYMYI